jgi:hypothetical protein
MWVLLLGVIAVVVVVIVLASASQGALSDAALSSSSPTPPTPGVRGACASDAFLTASRLCAVPSDAQRHVVWRASETDSEALSQRHVVMLDGRL